MKLDYANLVQPKMRLPDGVVKAYERVRASPSKSHPAWKIVLDRANVYPASEEALYVECPCLFVSLTP